MNLCQICNELVSNNRDGICDECGEYSEELAMVNSEWVCEGCRNLMGGME